jgi:AraC family transcriptional regulator of adaptative response / DNA-3-methyladenine glycosylase II
MLLNPDNCYQAMTARDSRFDGLFFVGVETTGVYCRPVCPAKTPMRDRCRFFGTAAGAERAGFRPCLRCRPELAPGHARIDAVSRLAAAVAQRIEDGALNEDGLEALAEEFGRSSRQLRRALREEFGVSPVELAQTQRLLLAKRLLTDTHLSVTEAAFAAGFASVRRFNALFRERYRLSPTELRRSHAAAAPADALTFELAYRPPLAWEPLLEFLASRAFAGVEAVEGRRYRRTVSLDGRRGWIAVEPADGRAALRLQVSASLAPVLAPLLARVRRLFDLDAQPDRIAAHLGRDPALRPLLDATPGLRVPGGFDGFELGLRAVLGQQVSVRAATCIAARFSEAFGEPVETPFPDLARLSPAAEPIARAEVSGIAALGVPAARAHTIRSLARAVVEDNLRLEPGADVEAAMLRLTALPGIGDWTAQYVALRALRWPDAFPAGDRALRKALDNPSPARMLEIADAWRPWRAYAAMHLWKSLGDKR